MATTLKDLAASLHSFFSEKVPGGAGDQPGDMLLVFDALGVPLDPREFGATADGAPLDVFANQRAAQLADQMPAANVLSAGSYLPKAGSRLSRWYEQTVSTSVATASADPELSAFEHRKADALQSFELNDTQDVALPHLGGVVGASDHHYATLMTPRDWFLPDSQAWSSYLQTAEDQPPPPQPEVVVQPIPIPDFELRVVEPQVGQPPPVEVVQYVEIAQVLATRKVIPVDPPDDLDPGQPEIEQGLRVGHLIGRDQLRLAKMDAPDALALRDAGFARADAVHLALDAQPAAAAADAAAGPADLPIAQPFSNDSLTMLTANALQAVVDASTTQPVKSQGFTLSFEYSIITFERPWWDEIFLNVPGWQVPGFARGELASGKASDPASQFVTLVTAGMVVVRNLRIQAAWQSADLAAAGAATSLGPFCIAGAQWNEQELSRPGLQVIAWTCQIPPVLPPN